MQAVAEAEAPKKTKRPTIRPLNKWVLIRKRVRPEHKNAEGIVIPEEKEEQSSFGRVVASAVKHIQPGEYVLFTAYPATIESIEEITGDRTLYLVQADEVYAAVDDWSE